ncbi:uncharacterized protein LOC106674217 [Cimex lectularius]|uniref:phospholipase A2 n=1 Tax=Cimex lectularius TaxID=79782 RepID=A0A8I6SDC5_CIMLE|nr:uncharacterized protein LOC106674217 [Cimex lectularius]
MKPVRLFFNVFSLFFLLGPGASQSDMPSFKPYTGARVSNNSNLIVFHCEQTIAVVELKMKRFIENCEFIEVVDVRQKRQELNKLRSLIGKPITLKFPQMMDLMSRCSKIPDVKPQRINNMQSDQPVSQNRNQQSLQLILPGTKWCGTGDIAANYFDLGTQSEIDKCCRLHDICPVKVHGYSFRYGVNNTSPITKSHCKCDQELKRCLKKENQPIANLMGQIYFNVIKIQCVSGTVPNLQVLDQGKY